MLVFRTLVCNATPGKQVLAKINSAAIAPCTRLVIAPLHNFFQKTMAISEDEFTKPAQLFTVSMPINAGVGDFRCIGVMVNLALS